MDISYQPIGILHSPFKYLNDIPNQPVYGKDIEGRITIFPKFQEGLKDLDGFSHVILLCHFHMTTKVKMTVVPSGEKITRGLFSTRSPNRPNPIGQSIVRLTGIENNEVFISDLDILDGTPVLDIKPYFKEHSCNEHIKSGWMNK